MQLGLVVVLGLVVGQGEGTGVPALMELAAAQAARPAPSGGDPVPLSFALAALGQAEALIEREGVPLDEGAREWLRAELQDALELECGELPPKPGPARTAAWQRLVREVTTPRLAQRVLDLWLGLPPVAIPDTPPTTGVWSQAAQTEGSETFKFESVSVSDEVGGAGSVNRLIDPGEWVQLEVSFTNATKLPWFSTSAFPKASGCVWVDEHQTSLVGEMAPGARASVSLWAFVPERCVEPASLRLTLSDTHRGATVGVLGLTVFPTGAVRPHATRMRLDTDALGWSDGSRATQIGAGMRFEFVTDVRVSGEAVSAVETRWSIPPAARPLFSALTYRPVPTVPQGGGLFAAGDDLDGETVPEARWAQLCASEPSLERWMVVPASGRLWLAMDNTVLVKGPMPRPAVPPQPLPLTPRGKKGEVKVSPVVPGGQPPSPSAVAELVRQFVNLEPHAVPRERPEAVEAVSGYELLFDRPGFMKAYADLIPVPAAPVEPVEPTARVVFRSYVALPAVPVPRARAPEPRVEVVEPVVLPEPPPAPVVEPRRVSWLQLDLGGGTSFFGVRTPLSLPGYWIAGDVGVLPTFSLRAFVGPSLVGVAGFSFSLYSMFASGTPIRFTEAQGELGVGYRFTVGAFSLTPYAALLLRWRTFSIAQPQGALGGLVAINTRWAFTRWFGLSLDLGVPLAMEGPFLGRNAQGVPVSLMDGVGFRAILSASVSF